MSPEEFSRIMSQFDGNDQLIFGVCIGAIQVPDPLIQMEAWRHALITGMFKKIDDQFEYVAREHINQGVLVSLN